MCNKLNNQNKSSSNSSKNNRKSSFNSSNNFNNKGLSLIECLIALILISMVLATLFTMTAAGVKNGRFVTKVADTRVLSERKAADVFKDIDKQLTLFPAKETRLGSLDPSAPVSGYFDTLNQSGCLLSNFIQPPNPTKEVDIDKIKTGKTGGTGRTGGPLDDFGKGDDDANNGGFPLNGIDCSSSTVPNPSQDRIPAFRRQWIVVRDLPSKNDVTVSVIIIQLDKNTITRSSTLTKIDGGYKKSN